MIIDSLLSIKKRIFKPPSVNPFINHEIPKINLIETYGKELRAYNKKENIFYKLNNTNVIPMNNYYGFSLLMFLSFLSGFHFRRYIKC